LPLPSHRFSVLMLIPSKPAASFCLTAKRSRPGCGACLGTDPSGRPTGRAGGRGFGGRPRRGRVMGVPLTCPTTLGGRLIGPGAGCGSVASVGEAMIETAFGRWTGRADGSKHRRCPTL
jgi:hypothetical protein